jgi:hypothetical protein
MELVEGQTLADRIARGPVAVREALQIAQQLTDALEAALEFINASRYSAAASSPKSRS